MLPESKGSRSVAGRNSRTHRIKPQGQSQASGAFIKVKKKRTLPKRWARAGQEKGNCAQELRSVGFYSNEGAEYSRFVVASPGVPAGLSLTTPFPPEMGLPCSYLALVRAVMVTQGMESVPCPQC